MELKGKCVFDGKCLLQNGIFKATVKTPEDTKHYVGSSGLTFKSKYTRHKCSFNDYKYRLKTSLSKYTCHFNYYFILNLFSYYWIKLKC